MRGADTHAQRRFAPQAEVCALYRARVVYWKGSDTSSDIQRYAGLVGLGHHTLLADASVSAAVLTVGLGRLVYLYRSATRLGLWAVCGWARTVFSATERGKILRV